eukprot:150026-Alexandrium_andersonii.AAC.1
MDYALVPLARYGGLPNSGLRAAPASATMAQASGSARKAAQPTFTETPTPLTRVGCGLGNTCGQGGPTQRERA